MTFYTFYCNLLNLAVFFYYYFSLQWLSFQYLSWKRYAVNFSPFFSLKTSSISALHPTLRCDVGMAKEFPVSSGSQHRKKVRFFFFLRDKFFSNTIFFLQNWRFCSEIVSRHDVWNDSQKFRMSQWEQGGQQSLSGSVFLYVRIQPVFLESYLGCRKNCCTFIKLSGRFRNLSKFISVEFVVGM